MKLKDKQYLKELINELNKKIDWEKVGVFYENEKNTASKKYESILNSLKHYVAKKGWILPENFTEFLYWFVSLPENENREFSEGLADVDRKHFQKFHEFYEKQLIQQDNEKVNFTPKTDIEEYLNNVFNLEIFKELTEDEDWKGIFEPLEFLNLLYEHFEIVNANKEKPLSVVKYLFGLNLEQTKLYYLIYHIRRYISNINLVNQRGIQLNICKEFISKELDKLEAELYPEKEPTSALWYPMYSFGFHSKKNTEFPILKKPELNRKLITFKNSETIGKIHSELKGFFPNKEAELLKALQGEQLGEILLFPHNGSSFVEVFKRLKYNGLLISTPTEIKDWICINFNFVKTQGTKKTVEAFKENSVWDVLTKTKCEPSKKNRICTPDWLPFIPQKTRQREAQKEKL